MIIVNNPYLSIEAKNLYANFLNKDYNLFNKILFYLLVTLFVGCGEVVSLKKYDADFFITQPLSLHVEDSIDKKDIASLLTASGFSINDDSSIHIEVTGTPLYTNCALTSPQTAKETFIRISVVQNGEERYRIQRNQKGEMSVGDIQKVIEKMKGDLVK